MAYNPESSATSYITPDDLFARMDINLICQLCSDTQVPIDVAVIRDDVNLLAALNDASGELESSIFVSKRYGAADLQALDGVSRQYMLRILSDLAAYNLWTRRKAGEPPGTVAKAYEKAQAVLVDLQTGQDIFSFEEIAASGVPVTYQMQMADHYNNNMLSTLWRRIYGSRTKDRMR